MKYQGYRRNCVIIPLVLLIGLLSNSCKKEPQEIGLEIQPSGDQLNLFVSDSIKITAYSIPNDSIRTDKTALSLLGSYLDPVFGKARASFFTQFLLSGDQADFGFSPELDSLVLSLDYSGYYGNVKTPLTIRIFEMTEDLYFDTSYYSHQTLGYDPVEIASFTITPRPTDSIYIDTIQYRPHLRLNISKQNPAFAEKILNGGEINLSDNENFLKFIKGIYVTVDPVDYGGSILYFDLMSALSKLTMYYSNVNYDSLQYDFLINDECARFGKFDNFDYADANPLFQQQVVRGDTAMGDKTLYIQAMQGLRVDISFPDIMDLQKQGNVAVNRAELVIKTLHSGRKLSPPYQLLLGILQEDGSVLQLPDQAQGTSYFGGIYDTLNSEYRFRISRHIQDVLSGTAANDKLSLFVAGRAISANRGIFGGPGHPESPMKLQVTYTLVN